MDHLQFKKLKGINKQV